MTGLVEKSSRLGMVQDWYDKPAATQVILGWRMVYLMPFDHHISKDVAHAVKVSAHAVNR